MPIVNIKKIIFKNKLKMVQMRIPKNSKPSVYSLYTFTMCWSKIQKTTSTKISQFSNHRHPIDKNIVTKAIKKQE
jgi:hypothetical protein